MVNLAIAPIHWCESVSELMAPSMEHEPGITVATLAEIVNKERAELFGVFSGAELVAAYVLRIEQKEQGQEGIIVAASGKLPGYSLIRTILPPIERQLSNCDWIRAHTARPGIVRELKRAGYSQREIVMAKGMHDGRI